MRERERERAGAAALWGGLRGVRHKVEQDKSARWQRGSRAENGQNGRVGEWACVWEWEIVALPAWSSVVLSLCWRALFDIVVKVLRWRI